MITSRSRATSVLICVHDNPRPVISLTTKHETLSISSRSIYFRRLLGFASEHQRSIIVALQVATLLVDKRRTDTPGCRGNPFLCGVNCDKSQITPGIHHRRADNGPDVRSAAGLNQLLFLLPCFCAPGSQFYSVL